MAWLEPSTAAWCGGASTIPSPPTLRRLGPHHRRLPPAGVLIPCQAIHQPEHVLFHSSATNNEKNAARISRRSSVLLLFPFLVASSPSAASPPVSAHLELYTDQGEGFTLLKPSSWVKVEKAGAAALFEEGKGSNNIGVVVNPVRLSSLKDFGTPEFVADKLIQAERRKESTKDAQVLSVAERLGHSGLPVYEFEYKVDSTRGGMKRIFSAAFVASRKLYLLNIAYSDRPDNPLDGKTRMVLEQVLHSFDTA
ncbi:psbP domain-containing protein 2, chloroplastic [Phoenix dactylifera]|uniref:PsbP domain-containing protein 2, chloroplastic n=1 Tax=Phoenix dactylifera TaxID=42345 RepID=A0A8B7BMM8_PHODC|nr:psbP domain-containing protein 2, chloroplastic [Phoenix dactylifera]